MYPYVLLLKEFKDIQGVVLIFFVGIFCIFISVTLLNIIECHFRVVEQHTTTTVVRCVLVRQADFPVKEQIVMEMLLVR